MFRFAAELYSRRTLVWGLTRRALVARYRGTALGFLWTFLHPLTLFGVYVLVFGVYVRLDVPDYAAFLCAGLLPWTWFAQGLAMGTTSALEEAAFLKQAAFPPAVPPLVTCLATGLNFLFALPILLGFLLALGIQPTVWLLLLPALLLVQGALLVGLTLATSALSVRYRDVVQLVQAALPLWFFLTPVVYPASMVPAGFRWLLRANPLAPLIGGYQRALLGRGELDLVGLAIVAAVAAVALLVGARVADAMRDRLPEEL